MKDRVEEELHEASQGLQKASALTEDKELSEWLDETTKELHDLWEEKQ